MVDALVTDALRLLGHLPDQQRGEKAANAVGILVLVASQDVKPAGESDGRDGLWRVTRGTAAGRMVSTVDPEARHVHKTRSHQRDGFKAHLAIEPETGLYTAGALRPGAGPGHHEACRGLSGRNRQIGIACHVYQAIAVMGLGWCAAFSGGRGSRTRADPRRQRVGGGTRV